MPHYVTFQSDMDRLRATRSKHQERRQDQQEVSHESEL